MGENRYLVSLIQQRLAQSEPLMQVVLGPRQVGKTTAVLASIDKSSTYETADYPTPLSYEVIEDWWQHALEKPGSTLAIDEVQKIPGWANMLKRLWDLSIIKPKVVITGSSALLMERGLSESLAGRFELIRAEHWNYAEAQRIFGMDLKSYIEFGCYPGAVPFLDQVPRWGSYIRDAIVEPVLGRDLLQMVKVENPALLRQLFGVAVSMPAQIVSLQKLQGQLQGKGTLPTIQSYLDLLKESFLVTGLAKYSESRLRVRRSSPKLIVHDNALIRAFERPIHTPIAPQYFGRYFENAVGARFIEAGWDTYYWKERDHEVDFVVVGPSNEKWAVEVKTSKVSEGDLKGLRLFCKRYPDFQPCMVSLQDKHIPGIKTLPVTDILSLRHTY